MRIDSAGLATFSAGIALDTAGAIGTVDADLILYTTTASHVGLRLGNGYIAPTDNAGAVSTGVADLGGATLKFKDAHFSGTVNSSGIAFQSATTGSGTASGYTLDSYEVGSFTATLKGSGAEPATLITSLSNYTRIGNRVYFDIGFENVDTTGYVNAISIIGATWTTGQLAAVIAESGTSVNLYSIATNAGWSDATHNAGTGRYFWVTGQYKTDA